MIGTWYRTRWVRVLLGLIAGAVAGLVVFYAGQLTGVSLFIVCGGFAGLVAALVVHTAYQTVRLTDVKVTVPQFSELSFTITRDSEQVAWRLFVETVTRVSTQTLASDGGFLREAMSSLYSIFSITREILKQSQPARHNSGEPTVEQLAITMLNSELRPFLTRWHPRLRAWEDKHEDEVGWPENERCRADLAELQQRLEAYILSFGKLARLPNAQQIVEGAVDGLSDRATVVSPRRSTETDLAVQPSQRLRE